MSNKRSMARGYAVQALYQWQIAASDVNAIIEQFLLEKNQKKFDTSLFKELVTGVVMHQPRLDEALSPLLDRGINSVDPVERAVLRLGAFELMEQPQVPYRVVINEAVEQAKIYGADQGHRYVNGVLDKLAKNVRAVEYAAKR